MVPLLALEEHFLSPDVRDSSAHAFSRLQFPAPLMQKLMGIGQERIEDMDKGHVSLQVISHAPTLGAENPSIRQKAQ